MAIPTASLALAQTLSVFLAYCGASSSATRAGAHVSLVFLAGQLIAAVLAIVIQDTAHKWWSNDTCKALERPTFAFVTAAHLCIAALLAFATVRGRKREVGRERERETHTHTRARTHTHTHTPSIVCDEQGPVQFLLSGLPSLLMLALSISGALRTPAARNAARGLAAIVYLVCVRVSVCGGVCVEVCVRVSVCMCVFVCVCAFLGVSLLLL